MQVSSITNQCRLPIKEKEKQKNERIRETCSHSSVLPFKQGIFTYVSAETMEGMVLKETTNR